MEACFARGDRRLAKVIIGAYKRGARFDSWDERFKKEAWEEAFAENGLTVEQFGNRRIGIDEPLAWQHMDSVVGMDYLRREYLRSREGIVTGDCRLNCNGCFGDRCGTLCDMHKPDSVWEIRKRLSGRNMLKMKIPAKYRRRGTVGMRIIASFYKHEQVMFVSHLDMQRLFQRAFRRADLPLAYSNGFNPHPLLSFATALSVGYTSDCEYFDVMLSEYVSPAEFKRRVNAVLPQGVHIVDAVDAGEFKASLTPLMRSAEYDIELEFAESVPREAFYAAVDEILNGGEIIVSKKTKGGIKDVDIRPMLLGLSVSEFGGRTAKLRLRGKLTAEGGLSPELLLGAFYKNSAQAQIQASTAETLKWIGR